MPSVASLSLRCCAVPVPRALFAACGLLALGATMAGATGEAMAAGESVSGGAWVAFSDWIAASYARAPALVLGLVALFAVPPLAVVGWLARKREAEALDVSQGRTQVMRMVYGRSGLVREGVRTGHVPLRPLAGWIEVENASEVAPSAKTSRYGLARALLRIGRETDNDICLEDMTVHRYHAAIHRTEDAEFVITDLSSAGGNGVVVNGRAVAEARLMDGDVIQLGKARLVFSVGAPVR